MNRRTILTTAASGLAWAPVFAATGKPSAKKGWAGGDARLHQQFGASWYYTWSPKTRPSKATEFVPMIKGEWSLKQAQAIQSMKGVSHLLGFNEPERPKQGNCSVDRAIALWPRLVQLAEAKQLRLGSPAPSSDRAGMAWLAEFMERAKRNQLKVDFVAAHWYRGISGDDFEDFVDQLARAYRLPIWITEFNGWSGTEEEHFRFLKASLRFLERHQRVERYAYFNPGKGKPHSLIRSDGSLTRMGELYRDAGTA